VALARPEETPHCHGSRADALAPRPPGRYRGPTCSPASPHVRLRPARPGWPRDGPHADHWLASREMLQRYGASAADARALDGPGVYQLLEARYPAYSLLRLFGDQAKPLPVWACPGRQSGCSGRPGRARPPGALGRHGRRTRSRPVAVQGRRDAARLGRAGGFRTEPRGRLLRTAGTPRAPERRPPGLRSAHGGRDGPHHQRHPPPRHGRGHQRAGRRHGPGRAGRGSPHPRRRRPPAAGRPHRRVPAPRRPLHHPPDPRRQVSLGGRHQQPRPDRRHLQRQHRVREGPQRQDARVSVGPRPRHQNRRAWPSDDRRLRHERPRAGRR
jgi:hypothetical protein